MADGELVQVQKAGMREGGKVGQGFFRLAELQLQVRWGDSEREQLHWRSLRLLPPDLENAR